MPRTHMTLIALTGSLTLAGPCDPATLLSGSTATLLGSGSDPRRIITEDLNADGNLDLVIARWGDDTVSVLLGAGNATFAPQVEYSLGEGIGMRPQGLGVADFDLDGNLDLAVGNTGDSTVTIMLGDGTGAFTSNGAYDAGFFVMPSDLIISDLDHDGDQDIVVASEVNQVRVMLNNGNGTFAPPVFNPIISSVNSIAKADLNGDGNDDIIATGFTTNEVFVLYGFGNGSLGSPIAFPTANSPADVQVADMDDDGDLDLVISTFFHLVSVHKNNGANDFSARIDYPCDLVPRDIKLADMDSDGDLDVIAATQSILPSSIAMLLNDGSGVLSTQYNFPGNSAPRGVAVGDFNDDAAPDVAAVFEVTNDLIIYTNQCPPTTCSCNPADLADPCGVLNFFDVSAFLVAYNAQDPIADFNSDGMVNFFDVSAFLTAFNNGCP